MCAPAPVGLTIRPGKVNAVVDAGGAGLAQVRPSVPHRYRRTVFPPDALQVGVRAFVTSHQRRRHRRGETGIDVEPGKLRVYAHRVDVPGAMYSGPGQAGQQEDQTEMIYGARSFDSGF